MKDGHLNKCKDCAKKDSRAHRYGDRREYVIAYDRERGKLPHRIGKQYIQTKKWRELNPDRAKAQSKLRLAVKNGEVIPLLCIICGAKAEAHHPDYSRPLDVMWLCPSHHKQAHALAKQQTL